MAFLNKWAPYWLSVLRIVASLLFLEHGLEKLVGFPAAGPALSPLVAIQGAIEVLGGAALLLGLYARPVAFILCGDMAAAYFMAHFPRSFYPAVNGGDAAVLYCFVFFYIVLAGAGPWSVDDTVLKRQ
jgi:putative oxidoreductase